MTMNEFVELAIKNDLDLDKQTTVYLKEGDKIIPLVGIEQYTHTVDGTSIYILTGELE